MLARYVADIGWTGYAVVSSIRVFHGLSAGNIWQPPIVGTAAVPPPLLLVLDPLPELPLLLPELPELLPVLAPPEPLLLLLPPLLDPLLLPVLLLLELPLPELDPVLELPLSPVPPSVVVVATEPSPVASLAHPARRPTATDTDTIANVRIADLQAAPFARPGPADPCARVTRKPCHSGAGAGFHPDRSDQALIDPIIQGYRVSWPPRR